MSTTDTERQTTGKITYDLGLTAVIDLDADTGFAEMDETNRRAALRALARAMQRRGAEVFGDLDANQIVLADEDSTEPYAQRGDLADLVVNLRRFNGGDS
jgi:hypothetical protein